MYARIVVLGVAVGAAIALLGCDDGGAPGGVYASNEPTQSGQASASAATSAMVETGPDSNPAALDESTLGPEQRAGAAQGPGQSTDRDSNPGAAGAAGSGTSPSEQGDAMPRAGAEAQAGVAAQAGAEARAGGAAEPPAQNTPTTLDRSASIAEEQWQPLIEGAWELPAGTEGYRCVRKTLERDLFVAGFRAIEPPGTHHTLLTIGPANQPDGLSTCNAGTNARTMLYGAGVGTGAYAFPEGVAMHLAAGQQLVLNLHLFNSSSQMLNGTSGNQAYLVEEGDVEHLAENVLAGTTTLNIPPGDVTQSGNCTMSHDVTVFGLFPHMHQLGVHMTATVHSAQAGDIVVHDEPYNFDLQTIYPLEALELSAGDQVSVECHYENPTDSVVRFGDSSLAEMCFLGLFRYPAAETSSGILCTR